VLSQADIIQMGTGLGLHLKQNPSSIYGRSISTLDNDECKVLIPKPRSFRSTCNAGCAMNMNFVALMNMERDNRKRSCRGFATHHHKDQDEQERKNTERERERERESPC